MIVIKGTNLPVTDPTRQVADQLNKIPVLDNQLIEDAVVSGATLQVRHSLGRVYRGAFVAGQSDTSIVITPVHPSVASDPARSVELQVTGFASESIFNIVVF